MIWNHPNYYICFDSYSLRLKLLLKLNRTAARIVCHRKVDNYASVLWSLFSSNKCALQNANCSFYKIHPAQITVLVKNNWRDAIHIIPIDLSAPTLMPRRGTVHHFINNCFRLSSCWAIHRYCTIIAISAFRHIAIIDKTLFNVIYNLTKVWIAKTNIK